MKKITFLILLFVCCLGAQAQSLVATSKEKPTEFPVVTEAVLFDQPSIGGNGIISAVSSIDNGQVFAADDFELTSNNIIELIAVQGFQNTGNLPSLLTGFDLYIYGNSASNTPNSDPTQPGTGLLEIVNLDPASPALTVNNGGAFGTDYEFVIDVTAANGGNELVLPAGNYWVVAAPRLDISPVSDGDNRWNWFDAGVPGAGVNEAHLIDPGDLFGSGATDWTSLSNLGVTFGSVAFRVEGVAGENFTCEDARSVDLGVTTAENLDNTAGGASNVCFSAATDAVWYRYTASDTGTLTISSDLASNTTQDTRVSVYNDNCSALMCLGSNDDAAVGMNLSEVSIPVVSGTSYLIEWDDRFDTTAFDFELSLDPDCPAPENFTVGAVADTSADFSWDLVPEATNGYILTVFNTGADPDTDTPAVNPVFIPVGINTATVTGLSSSTIYDAYLVSDCDPNGMSNQTMATFETNVVIPVCGDQFFDTGGANGDYQPSQDYSFVVEPALLSGDVVILDFTFVDIESGFDFLRIYNGSDATAEELSDPVNGVQAPGTFTANNPDGTLFVTFTSDGTVQNAGWEADVICQPPPACPNPTNFTVSNITDSTADFSWSPVANASMGYILSVFNQGDDPMINTPVYTEDIAAGTTIGTATGLMGITAYDAYITADCDADGLSTLNMVSFETLVAPPVCGGKFFDTGGPNQPYENFEDYSYLITPDMIGNVVILDFTFVDIESGFDFLRIYNGNDATAPELTDPANGLQEPGMFVADNPDGTLFVTFTSDFLVANEGWEADVICQLAPTCATPDNFAVSNITEATADFSWDAVADASAGYVLSVFNQGDDPDVDTAVYTEDIAAGTTMGTATGLTASTTYDAYIQADCDANGLSLRSKITFNTSVAPPMCGGKFFDTGGPNGDFMNNENYTTVILPDNPGDAVTAEFVFVDLAGGTFDILTVDIGDGIQQPVPDVSAGAPPVSFTSIAADGSLSFTFVSSTVVPNPGWEANILCAPLGVDDFTDAGFKMYPNPANSSVNVSANQNIERIELYNLLGQKVLTQQPNNQQSTVDVSGLSNGVYILQFSIDGNTYSERLIKE